MALPIDIRLDCVHCGLSTVLPQYPHPANYCVQCNHFMCKFQINAVLGALEAGLHDLYCNPAVLLEAVFRWSIDRVSCEVISSFLVPSIRQVQFEHSRACRYLFLKNTLLAQGSIFRDFTYFYGGMAGNISTTKMFLTAS